MNIIKGDCYEAGLWDMRNVEAMVRDGNVVNSKNIDREAIIGILLSAGNMSEGVIADAIIAAIGVQPVVELPEREYFVDGLEHKTIIKKDVIAALTAAGIQYTVK